MNTIVARILSMSIAERRERQRAERYERIVAAACELAEAEGWDAVTTRRLAELIDYSQPVLYSHFKGKADIMGAVAIRGFEELAARLRMAKANLAGESDHLAQSLRRLSGFRPVAAGCLRGDVRVADEDSNSRARKRRQLSARPSSELVAALGPDRAMPEILAEVLWSALQEWPSWRDQSVSHRQPPTFV